MENLIKRLEEGILYAIGNEEDMGCTSWEDQEGILISYNDAKTIVDSYKSLKLKNQLFIGKTVEITGEEKVVELLMEINLLLKTLANEKIR